MIQKKNINMQWKYENRYNLSKITLTANQISLATLFFFFFTIQRLFFDSTRKHSRMSSLPALTKLTCSPPLICLLCPPLSPSLRKCVALL